MTELESPGELLRRIYEEEFGFIPINASMKPVHMANGLYRRLCGVTYDSQAAGGRDAPVRQEPGREAW